MTRKVDDLVRITLVKKGGLPKQRTESESGICHKDDSNRRINVNNYSYTFCNAETIKR